MREWGANGTLKDEWWHEVQPMSENSAQVPRGPTVPVLGDEHTCPQRKTCIQAFTAVLPIRALTWKDEHKKTIPKRMDNKLWCIQIMKCYQAIEKNELLIPPATWMNLQNAKTRERGHTACIPFFYTVFHFYEAQEEAKLTHVQEISGCLCVVRSLCECRPACVYFPYLVWGGW